MAPCSTKTPQHCNPLYYNQLFGITIYFFSSFIFIFISQVFHFIIWSSLQSIMLNSVVMSHFFFTGTNMVADYKYQRVPFPREKLVLSISMQFIVVLFNLLKTHLQSVPTILSLSLMIYRNQPHLRFNIFIIIINNDVDAAQLTFASATTATGPPYHFRPVDGGSFLPGRYALIHQKRFSYFSVIWQWVRQSISRLIYGVQQEETETTEEDPPRGSNCSYAVLYFLIPVQIPVLWNVKLFITKYINSNFEVQYIYLYMYQLIFIYCYSISSKNRIRMKYVQFMRNGMNLY